MKQDKSFLLCPPDHYNISYSINPWMDIDQEASENKTSQWETLVTTFKKLNTKLFFLEPVETFPDMVFIDAGLIYQNNFIPSNFKFTERKGEREHFVKWFRENDFTIRDLPDDTIFEGHGDSLWAGENKLVIGYGFRTEKNAVPAIQEVLRNINPGNKIKLLAAELIDSRFYHLDTCFCPLNEEQALYFPDALSEQTISELSKHFELIAVPEQEATRFACNAVVVGQDIIIPANTPDTCEILENLGFKTHQVLMDEFIKAGGACKCLSMEIKDYC